MKKLFALVLALVMMIPTAFSVSVAGMSVGGLDEETEDLSWSFDELTGTLTISGIGNMKDYYDSSDVPWYSYIGSIKNIIVYSGVTSIGSYAFYRCTRLASITIPDSVTSIGAHAFDRCTGLKEVNVTDIAAWCNIEFLFRITT